MPPVMGSILFLLELSVCFYDCRGHALEQQSSMNLVSNQDLSDCPGGACVGIVSKAGYTPPLTVLFGHLPGQIVLSEPL